MADVDLSILKSEITNDPLLRGYAGMTDQQVADSMNSPTRIPQRATIDTWEIIEATVPAEWAALTSNEKQRYQTLISSGKVNVGGANTRTALAAMFANNTQTRANLLALQNGQAVSRAYELGLPFIGSYHVAAARAYNG